MKVCIPPAYLTEQACRLLPASKLTFGQFPANVLVSAGLGGR